MEAVFGKDDSGQVKMTLDTEGRNFVKETASFVCNR
jgi:hypothetical protein